ncbi:MAG: acyl-CoA dehydratase activase [Thermodesulfobacteriota bacterium]
MITAGIDCGAKYTKAVVLEDGRIASRSLALTGFDQSEAVKQALEEALKSAGISRDLITGVGGTGSGMKQISDADVEVNDVKAIAAAANFFFSNSRTVADVGAEHGRAVKVDDAGNVVDFAINEKCAAGTGSFIEAMARALETPLEQIGALALTSDKSIPMNAQCTIFAESEVVGLIHAGTTRADISKAIHDAIASRIVSLIRRIGVNRDIVIVGGVAYNAGFLAAVRRELGVGQLFVPDQPEYAAAVGAAVVAAKEGK